MVMVRKILLSALPGLDLTKDDTRNKKCLVIREINGKNAIF